MAARLFLVVALLILIGAILGHQLVYQGRVYPGVQMHGIDVGRMTPDEAEAALARQVAALGDAPLILTYEGQDYTKKLSDFSVQFDPAASAQEAFGFGRVGNILERLVDQASALITPAQARPVFAYSQAALERFITDIAGTLDIAATDAALAASPQGVDVRPAMAGRKVNVEKTIQAVRTAIGTGLTDKVPLVVETVPPRVVESELGQARVTATQIITGPIELKLDAREWTLSVDELAAMVTLKPTGGAGGVGWDATLDETALRARLQTVAHDIDRPAVNARIVREAASFAVEPSAEGVGLDVDRAVADIQASAVTSGRQVTLVAQPVRPAVVESDLAEAANIGSQMVSAPIELRYGDKSWLISREHLTAMVDFTEPSDGKPAEAYLDENLVAGYVGIIAGEINQPAKNAEIKMQNGCPFLVSESQDGLSVKVAETVAAIKEGTLSYRHVITVPVGIDTPEQRIVAKDLLKQATTSYAGSIAPRAHNVRLATSRLDGALIPPGETFSVNQALGPVTLWNGYQIGYGITMSGTEMLTVPSEGGGICQVATTLFHAAFWAGLEIEQRWPHLYWIERYGQPPLGMKGLDATVDEGGVDLKLKNNTGNWVLIKAACDASTVYFSLYGTDPGFEVTAEGPIISKVVPPNPEPVKQYDPTLPEDGELWVEHAEPGFDVHIERWVKKDGKEIDHVIVDSRYRPSRNVLAVGKPIETPTPGPGTPTASPTGTVTPAGTP